MKSRNTLVRLHKWQVDDKRKRLAELFALRDEFERKARAVQDMIAREQKIVSSASGGPGDVGFSYGAFAQAAIMQQDNLRRSIQSLDEQILEAREAVAEAFKSLKQQEIAAALHDSRKAKARNRQEQIASDDQAIESHQRKAMRK